MTTTPRFTVLIPTHNHGETIRYSVQSVLSQDVSDFELFIVGDGVSDQNRQLLQEIARSDARIRYFNFPKGDRHGERSRHYALQEARGTYICYLSDDDLWLPQHLSYMEELLRDADFAHSLPLSVLSENQTYVHCGDLSLAYYRHVFGAGRNFIPLSMCAHTTDLYRRLPFGWRPAPAEIYTDLYMLQQIFSLSDLRAVSGARCTAINFPSTARKDVSLARRCAELDAWQKRILDPSIELELLTRALKFFVRTRAQLESDLEALQTKSGVG